MGIAATTNTRASGGYGDELDDDEEEAEEEEEDEEMETQEPEVSSHLNDHLANLADHKVKQVVPSANLAEGEEQLNGRSSHELTV